MLQRDGPIINEGLKGLYILTLKHHLQLVPASMAAINLINIDVEGFQVVKSPGVEDFPVLQMMEGIEIELSGLPVVNRMRGHS